MEAGVGRRAGGAEGRRRGGRQPLADAVPGRRAGRAGRRAGDRRDDGARRGATWPGSATGAWTRGRRRLDVARGGPLRARDGEDERETLLGRLARAVERARAGRGEPRGNEAERSGPASRVPARTWPNEGAGVQGPAARRSTSRGSTSARATRGPTGSTSGARWCSRRYLLFFYRARGDRRRQRPGGRAGDPRAEPLLVPGPLLRRRLPAAQGALHGQVAAVPNRPIAVHLPPRRRLPRPARPPRRGGVQDRPRDPRARRHAC